VAVTEANHPLLFFSFFQPSIAVRLILFPAPSLRPAPFFVFSISSFPVVVLECSLTNTHSCHLSDFVPRPHFFFPLSNHSVFFSLSCAAGLLIVPIFPPSSRATMQVPSRRSLLLTVLPSPNSQICSGLFVSFLVYDIFPPIVFREPCLFPPEDGINPPFHCPLLRSSSLPFLLFLVSSSSPHVIFSIGYPS